MTPLEERAMNTGRLLPRAVLGLAIAAAISVSLAYRGQLDPAAFEAWLAGFGILAPLAMRRHIWSRFLPTPLTTIFVATVTRILTNHRKGI